MLKISLLLRRLCHLDLDHLIQKSLCDWSVEWWHIFYLWISKDKTFWKSNWFNPFSTKIKFHFGDLLDRFTQIWFGRSLNKYINFSVVFLSFHVIPAASYIVIGKNLRRRNLSTLYIPRTQLSLSPCRFKFYEIKLQNFESTTFLTPPTSWVYILKNYKYYWELQIFVILLRKSFAILYTHKKWSHTKFADLSKVLNAQNF